MQCTAPGERVGGWRSNRRQATAAGLGRARSTTITVISSACAARGSSSCLGAARHGNASHLIHVLYLLFGALSAVHQSFVVNRSGKREGTVRVALAVPDSRPSPSRPAASSSPWHWMGSNRSW